MNTLGRTLDIFPDINLNAFDRLLGDQYEVEDYANVYDLYQGSYKQNAFSLDQCGITTGVVDVSGLASYGTYTGRGAIYHLVTTGLSALTVSVSIPANVADDTTRFRNTFGSSFQLITAGTADADGYKIIVLQSGSGDNYWFLPYGAIVTVSNSALVVSYQITNLNYYNFAHNTGSVASFANSRCALSPWDGSHYLCRINASLPGASQFVPFLVKNNRLLFGFGLTSTTFLANGVSMEQDHFFSNMFIYLPAITTPALGVNDARNAYIAVYGKRFKLKQSYILDASNVSDWVDIINIL